MNSLRLTATIALVMPLAAMACSKNNEARTANDYDRTMTPAARVAPSSPGELGNEPSERLSDPQTTTILRAINTAEVDQARIAVGKAHDDAVKHFAEMMIAQHGQAVKDIDALADRMGYPSTDSQLVQELRVKATGTENRLSETNDSSFDKLYMNSQVDMHRLALDTIDTRLTPAATGEDLKQLISSMRPKVAEHLQSAQTIVHNLQ